MITEVLSLLQLMSPLTAAIISDSILRIQREERRDKGREGRAALHSLKIVDFGRRAKKLWHLVDRPPAAAILNKKSSWESERLVLTKRLQFHNLRFTMILPYGVNVEVRIGVTCCNCLF